MIGQRKPSLTVGLHFSLGHSAVVALACAAMAAGSTDMLARISAFRDVGDVLGTTFSATCLLLIAAGNAYSFFATRRAEGTAGVPVTAESMLPYGLMKRLLGTLMGLVAKPWHSLWLGAMFGLGFDTAGEIGLLGLSASQMTQHFSPVSIMVFPALFAAGMCLLDTSDGVALASAYGWALTNPGRRLRFNLTITLISVLAAVAVALWQTLDLLSHRLMLRETYWHWIQVIDEHSATVGVAITVILLICWMVYVAIQSPDRDVPAGSRVGEQPNG